MRILPVLSVIFSSAAFWGICGAFVFAVNVLIFSLYSGWSDRARRYRAIAEFTAALVTGAIFAQGFTDVGVMLMDRFVKVDYVAVALTIGWSSNYLWPKILRRLGNKVDSLPIEGNGK